MRTFDFNKDGDWTLDLVGGKDEILQSIEHSLKTRLTEWFLNETIGLDRENIESKVYDERLIASDITATIKQDDRVVDVESIKLDFDRRSRRLKVFTVIQAEINDEMERLVLDIAI